MHKSLLYFVTFLFSFTSSWGQDKQIDKKLDELFTKQFNQTQPGCEVLVARHGQVLYKKAFGSANLELNVPLKANMLFNLGSITKQFTAVAILQLVEQNKISLEDSLQKFVPDFPSKGNTITIENLLTHTSGIKDYMEIDYKSPNMERWDFTPKQLIDSFKNYALNFKPGTKFSYSNSGYYLLGYIIQKISGTRYQDYIQDNLLTPLGLTNTYFDSAGIIIPNRVTGYYKNDTTSKNVDYWSPTIEYAAGGLISNVEDLLKWHNGLYSYKILKKETLQKAFKSYQLGDGTSTGYGYGWFIRTTNGISSIEHEGGLPGFVSNEIYFPAEDIFIVILCNSGTAPINVLSLNVSNIALERSLQIDVEIDTKILDKYIGVYKLSIDTNRTLTISKQNNKLVAEISEAGTFPLLFQTEKQFQFQNLLDADCEFIFENDKVTKISVNQHGHYEWIRTK